MSHPTYRTFLAVMLGFAIMYCTACSTQTPPSPPSSNSAVPQDSRTKVATPPSEAPRASAPKENTVKATDLAKEYEGDKKATNDKYGYKRLSVEGIVDEITVDGLDTTKQLIILKGEGKRVVNCQMSQKADESVKPGQTVVIRGDYTGNAAFLKLSDCEVAK